MMEILQIEFVDFVFMKLHSFNTFTRIVMLHKMRSLFKDKMKPSLVLKCSIFTQEI